MTVERQDPGTEPAETQESNPFEGFESEGYERGERVADEPPPEPKEETDEEVGDDDEEEPKDDPKPKQTAQERINEVTRLRREAERKAEALQVRLDELEAAARQREPSKRAPEPPVATESATDEPPDPDDFDYGEIDPRYIAALVTYQTDQRIQAYERTLQTQREQERLTQEQQEVRAKFESNVVAKGSKVHDDFVEKVVIGAERGDWALSEDLGKMLVESDAGADIAYHLATHPEEALQVFRLPPVEQARYFGRMEAKFSAVQTAAPGKSETTKTPKAPPPVLPARGSDGKFQPSADSDDFSAFEKHALTQGR